MKKIVILTTLGFSILTFAKKSPRKIFVYDKNQNAYIEAKQPGAPGDPVPIDGYIPILLLAGAGMAVWYGHFKNIIKKEN